VVTRNFWRQRQAINSQQKHIISFRFDDVNCEFLDLSVGNDEITRQKLSGIQNYNLLVHKFKRVGLAGLDGYFFGVRLIIAP
jgi:hypothetical protein